VAVKVAENVLSHSNMKGQDMRVKASSGAKDRNKSEVTDVAETIDVTNIATVQLPPQFPIIIDEQAVEDILGVGLLCVCVKEFLF